MKDPIFHKSSKNSKVFKLVYYILDFHKFEVAIKFPEIDKSERYCIAQTFWHRKILEIWRNTDGSANFTIQILTVYRDMNKESKQAGIH